MTKRLLILLVSASLLTPLLHAEKRTFIDQSGRPLEGELVSASGDMVTIKRTSDGQTFTLKATNFSKADQSYFASKGGAASTPAVAPAAVTAPVTPSAPAPTVGSTSANTAPMRIEVKVYPSKNQRSRNNYTDYKIEHIGYRVDVRNGEQKRDFKGAKGIVIAFAENLADRSEMGVILRDEFEVNLAPLAAMTHETKEAKLSFDNVGYKYGYKYSGFVTVIKDSGGKTVGVSASSTTVAKFAEDIIKLSVNDMYDKNYKFVKKGYVIETN